MRFHWSFGFVVAGLMVVAANLSPSEAKSMAKMVDDEDATFIRLVRLEEKRSALSYRNSSGSLANSNKHVLSLIFKTLGDSEVSTSGGQTGGLPGGTTGTTGGTTSTTGSPTTGTVGEGTGSMMMLLEPDPPPTTGVTTGSTTGVTTATTGATTSTTGSTTGSTGGGSEVFQGYYFYVASPGEMAPIGSRTPTVYNYSSSIPDLPTGLRIQFYPGEEVTVHMASDAALSSGSIQVTVEVYTLTHTFDNPSTTPNEESWDAVSAYSTVDYDVTKYLCQDSSIDTRKAFGTPNREGELPDDANAAPAELNFGGSVWRGGTFVGNMHWNTRDMSGLARAQIYPQGTSGRTTNPRMAALAMFYKGTAPNVTNSVTIGAYTPASTDTNFGVGAGAVTWPTRWNILPRTTPGSPRDPAQDPMFRVPFTSSTTTGEYATWTLTDTMKVTSSTPSTITSAIFLAIENETEFLTNGTSAWRYFASDTFPSEVANTFPNNDSMPRLWVVDVAEVDDFFHSWDEDWWLPE